jgi:hypothetical protein
MPIFHHTGSIVACKVVATLHRLTYGPEIVPVIRPWKNVKLLLR